MQVLRGMQSMDIMSLSDKIESQLAVYVDRQ